MGDPQLEQHPDARRRPDGSEAAARLAEADVIVAGLTEWCRDVLFGTEAIDTEDQANGLSVLAPMLTTQYPEHAFRGIPDPEPRQSLEAGFRALIEGNEHPRRDVIGWLFGKALVCALEQSSERIRLLVPKLWNMIKYDLLIGSAFVESLRDLMGRSRFARRMIIDLLESRIDDIKDDPSIGAVVSHDRENLRQAVAAWRANPSIDRLREHEFMNFEDALMSMIPGLLDAARNEIIDRLDRLDYPHPIQQILFRPSVIHNREEIAALLENAPSCSDDGVTWNHRLFALLVLRVADEHCNFRWPAVCRAVGSDSPERNALGTVKNTLVPWLEHLGRIVMARADAQFLGAQWLFTKVVDERQQRAHYEISRHSPDRHIPQADLIEWVALGLAKAGLTASMIADQVDFSTLPLGGKIAPSRPTPCDSDAHLLAALFAMCLVDDVSDNSCGDVEPERLSLLDRLLASRHTGFELETSAGGGLDSLSASYFANLVANEPNPAERWQQSWDLLVEQRRRVQHWVKTNDSDALAPSLFLLAIGMSGVALLLSPPDSRTNEARALWRVLFDSARECWLTMTLSHLSESIETHIQRLFCWHPMVYCELIVSEDTSETSTLCSGEEYVRVLSRDLDFLGGDHLMLAICILNATRNGATPAIMNDVLKRNSGRIGTRIRQFEEWQQLEREVRKRPDIVAELAELKESIEKLA